MALTLLGNLLWNPMKLVSLKVTALGGVPLCENLMQRSPSVSITHGGLNSDLAVSTDKIYEAINKNTKAVIKFGAINAD
jgi:hypothetical protein